MTFSTDSPKLTDRQNANVRANVERILADTRHGRRDLKWLADVAGLNYSTVWLKIAKGTRPITEADERAFESALNVSAGALRRALRRRKAAT